MATNDGWLHMFRNTAPTSHAQDGSERWAFIPREIVPGLDRLRSNVLGGVKHLPIHYRLKK